MTDENKEYSLDQLDAFLSDHSGRGTLRVQVVAAKGLFPVQSATVEVSAPLSGTRVPIYRRLTDESGIITNLSLPAKPRIESQREATAGKSGTEYRVSVTHPDYLPLSDRQVVVYDGIETIDVVEMQPRAI